MLDMQKSKELGVLLKDFDTVMMITVTPEGFLMSRPMATQGDPLKDSESDIWFVTSLESGKAHDLEIDPRVNLSYYKGGNQAWVSIAGRGRIERNSERVKQIWKDDWSVWFSDGPEDPTIGIIHVEALLVTHWHPEGSRVSTMFSYAKAYVTGEQPNVRPPKHIDFTDNISS